MCNSFAIQILNTNTFNALVYLSSLFIIHLKHKADIRFEILRREKEEKNYKKKLKYARI